METVLHVGFHKTGTTMLQRQFFPTLPDCHVLAPSHPYFRKLQRRAQELCTLDEYDDGELRKLLAWNPDGAGTLIVSLEDLSMHHARGRTATRLHALAPDAKILICVRDQRTALESMYGLYVRHGGTRTLAGYAHRFEAWFHYDVVVDDYMERFGADRVKVLPYELLVESSSRYLGEIRAFVVPEADAPEEEVRVGVANRGMVPAMRWTIRHANRLFLENDDNPHPAFGRSNVGPFVIGKLLGIDRRLASSDRLAAYRRRLAHRTSAEAERLAARCATSNARLAQLTGVGLAEYGYRLPD